MTSSVFAYGLYDLGNGGRWRRRPLTTDYVVSLKAGNPGEFIIMHIGFKRVQPGAQASASQSSGPCLGHYAVHAHVRKRRGYAMTCNKDD